MNSKRKVLTGRAKLSIILILFISICFISLAISAENTNLNDALCASLKLPPGCSVSGSGISVGSQKILSFSEDNSYVTIKGNKFENIKKDVDNPGKIQINNREEITYAEFEVNDKGQVYNIGGTEFYAPPNSKVIFKDNKISIFPPENSEIKQLPSSKDGKGPDVEYSGKNIKIDEKNSFDGSLSFKPNGQAFISAEQLKQGTIINNVEIKSKQNQNNKINVNVFFDGAEHDGNYVSFGGKNLLAKAADSNFLVNFRGGNVYAQVDKGDFFALNLKAGSEFSILNRDAENLIPKVVTKGKNIEVYEDSKSIDGSDIVLSRTKKIIGFESSNTPIGATTSPIELSMLDKDGSNLISFAEKGSDEKKGYKIIVDNFNRMVLVPENDQEYLLKSFKDDLTFKVSNRIDYNYIGEEEIAKLTGKAVKFENVNQGNKDLVLGKLREYWETLTPETREAIDKINFLGKSDFNDMLSSSEDKRSIDNVAGFASKELGFNSLYFRDDESFELYSFRHEAAHALNFVLIDELVSQDPNLRKIGTELLASQQSLEARIKENLAETENLMGDDNNLENAAMLAELNKQRESFQVEGEKITQKSKEFLEGAQVNKDWADIAGKIDSKIETYGKSQSEEPKYGYVRPYGATSYLEDIATFVEAISTDSYKLAEMFDEKNPWYEVYKKKLDYLYAKHFISEGEYNNVLNTKNKTPRAV